MFCRRETSKQKKRNVIKSKPLLFREVFGEDLVSPSLCQFDDPVLSTLPTGYSSSPQFVSNVEKERLADIRKAPHLFVARVFDAYDAVWPFP